MVDIKEKINEYLNNKVQCVKLELETVHDAHFTTLAYLQALADAELITMKEFNSYCGELMEKLLNTWEGKHADY
jgi:hypothetical protein